METAKKIFLLICFAVGLTSLCLLFLYILAGVVYVFSDVEYVGDIAFIPKWIFLFSPLVFLAKTRSISEIIERL